MAATADRGRPSERRAAFEHADVLRKDSTAVIDAGRQLRDLSTRILAEVDDLRRLEVESRSLSIGSPEFERLSREIAERARDIFRMSGEQLRLAEAADPDERTIEDLERASP